MPDQCDGCFYVRTRSYGESSIFECHRSPPTMGARGKWPEVLATDWCGEFAATAPVTEVSHG